MWVLGPAAAGPGPVAINGISTAIRLSTGESVSCAILANATVQCWGFLVTFGDTPVNIDGFATATQISAGGHHACAVLADGVVRCIGANDYGQMGNNDTERAFSAVTVSGITNAIRIGSGGDHSCAVLNSGAVRCWGWNYYGQLGYVAEDANNPYSRVPVPLLPALCTMDVDGDGVIAINDALLFARATMGLSGNAVVQNAVAPHAVRNQWFDMRAYLMRKCGMQGLRP